MAAIFRKTTCFLASGILIFGLAGQMSAQSVGLPAPRLLTTTPMGGKVGSELEIAITGDFLDDAGDLIFSDARIKATPKKDAEGKVVPDKYLVKIDKACPPGLYEARIMTRLGISSSRVFVVGTLDEVQETKANNTLATANSCLSKFRIICDMLRVEFICVLVVRHVKRAETMCKMHVKLHLAVMPELGFFDAL